MRGSGILDQDIMDFASRLDNMKNVITRVDAPQTTKTTLGTAIISDFALSCYIKSTAEIAASMPENPIIQTEGENASGEAAPGP
jgi:hypothetical protein